jgi:hypothetical protein
MHHNVIDSNISHIDCGQEWLAVHIHVCRGAGVHNGFLGGGSLSLRKLKKFIAVKLGMY